MESKLFHCRLPTIYSITADYHARFIGWKRHNHLRLMGWLYTLKGKNLRTIDSTGHQFCVLKALNTGFVERYGSIIRPLRGIEFRIAKKQPTFT
jgi:hypothetical protein